jgi:hypothetical protein
VKAHFRQRHLIDQDSLPRFVYDENLVISHGFLASPGKLCHCPKEAACTLGRQNFGKLLWDLAVEGKLLELGEAQVAQAVMPAHELGLIGGGRKLDIVGFLGHRQGVKVKRPSSDDP